MQHTVCFPVELDQLRKNELKKHVAAIHIKNALSLLERKISNILLLNAYDQLLTQTEHVIRIRHLAQVAGFDSHDHQILKNALQVLAETTLQWNILDAQGKQEEWGVCTMLAQAKIRNGICYYAYSPDLSKKLYNPEIYARINLAIQRKFSSGYAFALYENCIRYLGVGSTGWWDLEKFRSLLGVGEKEYPQFKDLNRWVIKPSVEQVNECSDILLSPEFQREKRRIVALRFGVEKNLHLRVPLQDDQGASEEAVSQPIALIGTPAEAVNRLQAFGLTELSAQKLVNQYGESYVLENLAVVEKEYLAGKVDNLPGYTMAALRQDYRPKVIPFEQEQTRRQQNAKVEKQQHEQAKVQLEQFEREFSRRRLQQALDALTIEERERLEGRFREAYTGNLIYQKWGKDGLTHPVIQSLFRAFASQELLPETVSEPELATCAADLGLDLVALRIAAGM